MGSQFLEVSTRTQLSPRHKQNDRGAWQSTAAHVRAARSPSEKKELRRETYPSVTSPGTGSSDQAPPPTDTFGLEVSVD